ncbi:hypothetical protein [Duganella sp. Dugasp56]|uniref:hypothetical protein n=1 Tax=Duganella sp. Dugasp56 TaxID=3243046 RepID=UPI0039AF617D
MKRLTVMVVISSLAGCATQQSNHGQAVFVPLVKKEYSALKMVRDTKRSMFSAQIKDPTTTPEKNAALKAEVDAAEIHLSTTEAADLAKAFNDVLADCNKVISGMASKAETQESNAFLLSMSGLVFGSVLGPAATASNAVAHRAFISAASGWAGATNLAGQNLRTLGLAGDGVATTRNTIVGKMNDAIGDATNTEYSFDKRFAAVQKVQASCISYSMTVAGAVAAIPAAASAGGDKGGEPGAGGGK